MYVVNFVFQPFANVRDNEAIFVDVINDIELKRYLIEQTEQLGKLTCFLRHGDMSEIYVLHRLGNKNRPTYFTQILNVETYGRKPYKKGE